MSENRYQNLDRVISSLYTFITVGSETVKLLSLESSDLDLIHFKIRHTSDVRISVINDLFIDAQFKLLSRDDSEVQFLRTRPLSHPVRIVIRKYTEKDANDAKHPINNDLKHSTLMTHHALQHKIMGVQMQLCALDAKANDLIDVVRSNKYLVDLLSFIEKQSKDAIFNIQVLEALNPESTMIDAVKKRPEIAFELILQILSTLDALATATNDAFNHGNLTVAMIHVAEVSSATEPKPIAIQDKNFYLTQGKLLVKIGTFTHTSLDKSSKNTDLVTLLESLTNLEDAGGHLKMLTDANKDVKSVAELIKDPHFQKYQKGGGYKTKEKLKRQMYVDSENTEQFYGVNESKSNDVTNDVAKSTELTDSASSSESDNSTDSDNPFISSSGKSDEPKVKRMDFEKLNKRELQEYLKRTQSSTESDSSDVSDVSSSDESSDSSSSSDTLEDTSQSSSSSSDSSDSGHGRPRNTSRIRQLNETIPVYNKKTRYPAHPGQSVGQPMQQNQSQRATRFGGILGMPNTQAQMQQMMPPTNSRLGSVLGPQNNFNQQGGFNQQKQQRVMQTGGGVVPHIPDAAGTPFRTNQHRETDAARYNEKPPATNENDSLVEVRVSKDVLNPNWMSGKPPAVPQNPLAFNPFMPINYNPYMGMGLPGMGGPMYPWTYDINKVPIVRQIKVNLSNPGGDHITLSKIYEDIIPDDKFRYSFSTLSERMGMMQILRQILLRFNQNGELISVGSDTGTTYNSKDQQLINLLHHVKYLEVNPQHTGMPTPNPYDSLPVGMLTFQAAYPIRYNAEYNTVTIARNAIGLILRFLMTKKYHWSPGSVYRDYYFDVWRERRYYEWVRDEIVTKLVSPNFALMHAFFFTDNDRIQWAQIGGRATDQENVFDSIMTKYSGETSSHPSYTLLMLTESYTNSLRKWTTPMHSDHGKAQKMINIGYYAPNVWESVIFQILSIMCVLEKYHIYFNVDPQTFVDHFFIRDLRQNQQNTGYWRYTIDGVDYYCHNMGYLVIFDSRFFRREMETRPPPTVPSGGSSDADSPIFEFKLYSPVIFPGDENRVVIDVDGMTVKDEANKKAAEKRREKAAAEAAAKAAEASGTSASGAAAPEPTPTQYVPIGEYQMMTIRQFNTDEIKEKQRAQFMAVIQFVHQIASRAALPSIVQLVENIQSILITNPTKSLHKLLPELTPYALHSRIGSLLYAPEEDLIVPGLVNFRRGELVVYNNGLYRQWALYLGPTSTTGRINIIIKASPTDTIYMKKTVARGSIEKFHPNKKVDQEMGGSATELEHYVMNMGVSRVA
jgi:hypothetical protein